MKSVAGCGLIALLLSACSTAIIRPTPPAVPLPAFAAWSQVRESAKRVCVLPFADHTGTEGLAAQVRQSFAGRLSVKRFVDAELHEIDARLSSLPTDWREQPAQYLGKALECDALVYGEVTKAGRLYIGVYSRVFLEGAIRMVETSTSRTLVQSSYTTRFHAGGLPLSPFGVVAHSVLNLRNMDETQMVRVIDDLGRHLAEAVPDLPATSPVHYVSPSIPLTSARSPQEEETPQIQEASVQGGYRVQVASFRSSHEARQAARLLRDKGYRPAIAEFTAAEQPWHRVVLGPFPSFQEANQVGSEIQQFLPFSPVVTHMADR